MNVAFEIPVFATAVYWIILSLYSIRENRQNDYLLKLKPKIIPGVTVLFASYNEKYVIENSLEAIMKINYPKEKLQVIVADDSSDETTGILDRKVHDLKERGIDITVSRRKDREKFKIGALKNAMKYVKNDLVMLLDADSVLRENTLMDGVVALEKKPEASFVQFRVGYYNRSYNFTTRLFALSQDLMDTSIKKGSSFLGKPFSIQGGFTLIRADVLKTIIVSDLESITEDTELSVLMSVSGLKGLYLSYSKILSECPFDLEIWKKQSLRVSQGWGLIVRNHGKQIIKSKRMTLSEKAGLFLLLLLPFSNVSWIVVNILSSVFTFWAFILKIPFDLGGPFYTIFLTVPSIPFFISGAYALYFEGLFKPRDIIMIPALSYIGACTVVLGAYGFISGLLGKSGYFYRTPKMGNGKNESGARELFERRDKPLFVFEIFVCASSFILSGMMFMSGNYIPTLTLLGFALVTFKSLNLPIPVLGRKELPHKYHVINNEWE
ncbi:MAG: glycosyltransferase family 2 protein [Thermoplasmataceae archaeon]